MRIDGSLPSYSAFSTQKKGATAGSDFAASLDDFDQSIGEDTSGEEDGGSYDFSHMTPAEMRELSGDLYDSGELDLAQVLQLQLSGRPFGKIGPDGTLLPLSDAESSAYDSTSQDFIGIANNEMDQIESQGRAGDPTSGYQSWQSILSVLNGLQLNGGTEDEA
ncbi:hypothetical protein GCM10010520_62700 [Rhizobium viscosum]|uniref:Uncharacterized protein n=1 Tax=Rhizobium viscosum TaxID=1673 RepID=A0ABR9J1C4_RHIVS|nr:hypothetical protein [Rhizobium viscosum]MBE1509277.1 hypothetical protein [Rhizobium viscosum]